MEKKCKRCKSKFEPVREWQKYCGEKCRIADWLERHPRIAIEKEKENGSDNTEK